MNFLPEHGPVDSAPFAGVRSPSRRAVARVYRVGEVFHRGRRGWPAGAEFGFGPAGHELTLFEPAIGPGRAADVGRGPAEFALIVAPPVLVLSYRFGASGVWGEAPYSWHLQPEFRRLIPAAAVAAEARALLWITLVGADDGVIHAQRGMTLAPAFTRALHDAIREQAVRPFDPCGCTAAIADLYLKHPEPSDRLEVAVARTMGNA